MKLLLKTNWYRIICYKLPLMRTCCHFSFILSIKTAIIFWIVTLWLQRGTFLTDATSTHCEVRTSFTLKSSWYASSEQSDRLGNSLLLHAHHTSDRRSAVSSNFSNFQNQIWCSDSSLHIKKCPFVWKWNLNNLNKCITLKAYMCTPRSLFLYLNKYQNLELLN